MVKDLIRVTDLEAEQYLKTVKMLIELGGTEKVCAPFIVMVKGYGDDWENYSELTVDDLDNDNVVEAGYEDYQLWLNDTLTNLLNKGEL